MGVVLMGRSSQIDVDGAGRGRDAGTHGFARGVVSSPVRRSRTAPARSGRTQLSRCPCGSRAASGRRRARRRRARRGAVGVDLAASGQNRTRPPSASSRRRGPGAEPLEVQLREHVLALWRSVSASSRPAGPQAHASRARQSGTSRRGRRSRRPCRRRDARAAEPAVAAPEPAQLGAEDHLGADGATCTSATSGSGPAASRARRIPSPA